MRRRVVGVLIVSGIGVPLVSTMATADEPPVPLSVSPATVELAADGTAELTIANATTVDMTVTLRLVGDDGSEVSGGLPAGSQPIVGAGELSVDLAVEPVPTDSLELVVAASPIDGVLPLGAVVRVPVVPATADGEAGVASWQMRRQWVWFGFGRLSDTDDLPLAGTCGGLGITNGNEVGVLEAGGRSVRVTADCASPEADVVDLDISSVSWDGATYKGTIDLAPDDDEAGDVEVELTTTMAWWLVAPIIAAGIAVAVWLDRWRGRGREIQRLLWRSYRIEALASGKASVDKRFQKAATDAGLPDKVTIWTIHAAVKARANELRSTVRSSRYASPKEVETRTADVDAFETQVSGWPALAKSLAELQHRIDRMHRVRTLRAVYRAATLDRDGPITLAAAAVIATETKEALAFVADWPHGLLEDVWTRAAALPSGSKGQNDAIAMFDVLKGATTAEFAWAEVTNLSEVMKAITQDEARLRGVAPGAIPAAGGTLPERFDEPVVEPEAAARAAGVKIFLADVSLVVILGVAAVLAGLQALVFDKAFGGWADVAIALGWGMASGAVIAPLATVLANAGQSALGLVQRAPA